MNDSGTLVHSRFLTFSDGASRVSYRAGPFATHYQVAAWPNLRETSGHRPPNAAICESRLPAR